MDTIKVVIRKDTGAIEITPELVEQALNFYFGMDASVTVFAAVEHHAHADGAKRAWHGVYPGHEEGCVCLLCEASAPQVA